MPRGETKFSVPRFDADSAPLPVGVRCIPITVPDDIFFVQTLAAAYALLTRRTNWEGDQTQRTNVALLLNAAFEATNWEECMNCDIVAACIATNPATRTALDEAVQTFIRNASSFTAQGLLGAFPGIGNYTFPAGQPQSSAQQAVDQANKPVNNPSCNYNITWAQSLALVQATNRAIEDIFQKVEAATNAVELADAASDIPILVWIKEAVGGTAVLEMIQYYQNSIAEGYAAQYTAAIENEIACQIFCRAKLHGCEITIADVCSVMFDRLSAHATIPVLESFTAFLEFVTGLTVNGTLVVDLAFFMAWWGVSLGNWFFAEPFSDRLKLICDLAVSSANNNWTLLCTSCPVDLKFYTRTAGIDPHVTIQAPNGFTTGEFVIIVSPWTVTLVMDIAIDITNVELLFSNELSGGVAPNVDIIINGNTYPFWHNGNVGGAQVTHDITVTEHSNTIIIQADHDYHYLYSIRVRGTL